MSPALLRSLPTGLGPAGAALLGCRAAIPLQATSARTPIAAAAEALRPSLGPGDPVHDRVAHGDAPSSHGRGSGQGQRSAPDVRHAA